MATLPVQVLAPDAKALTLSMTALDTTGNRFQNSGQEILFLFGGNGTTGGDDVDLNFPTSIDVDEAETLNVKCGSTSDDNFSFAGTFKPRNSNIGNGTGLEIDFDVSTANVAGAAVRIQNPVYDNVPFVAENILVGAGSSVGTALVGGDPALQYTNDGSTIFIFVSGTSAASHQLVGTLPSGDSERQKTVTGTSAAIGDVTVYAPMRPADHGPTVEFSVTSSASTDGIVYAYSLLERRFIMPG